MRIEPMTTFATKPPSSVHPVSLGVLWAHRCMEFLVLALVVLSPWAFASVHPVAYLILYVGLGLALLLWSIVLLVERRLRAGMCPVALCLSGMVLLGVWQLIPFTRAELAIVSPGTFDLRSRLIPAELESLTTEETISGRTRSVTAVESATDRWSVSFDPWATRTQVFKLVAVLALFGLVRYEVASPDSFRRLAIVATVNGTLLSGFAIIQKLTAPPQVIYWEFESQGSVFGPFVCRNHFPFYVNICLGLGLGLLLGSRVCRKGGLSWSNVAVRVGQAPAVLWLIVGLGLMLAATVQSLSRGGVVSILGALLICGGFVAAGRRGAAAIWSIGIVIGIGLVLISWLGIGSIEKRLDTIWAGDALVEGRGPLWERTFPLVSRFPLWGTGYGTFDSIERTCRHPADVADISFEHAHNEYLEVLIEGGLCQLLLALTATGFVLAYGIRAYRGFSGGPGAGWVLGGLLGFTTVVLHAGGDFGLHIPSIVVLTTVLAAHLVALGTEPKRWVPRWTVLPACVTCLVVAVALPLDGWNRERAERFRLAALRAEKRLPPGSRDLQIDYLLAASKLSPDDPALRLALADARYQEYLAKKNVLRGRESAAMARLVMGQATMPGRLSSFAVAVGYEQWVSVQLQNMERVYLWPAIRDYLRTRGENPLMPGPHLRLAGCREYLVHPEAATNYLERACLLAPADAGLWYLVGLQHMTAGEDTQAWASWQRSLTCSSAYLSEIVSAALSRIGAGAMIERVLPPAPDLLVSAAKLPALDDQPLTRRLLLLRAADLLPDDRVIHPDDLHLRAWALREAGREPEAIVTYRRAVERSPDQVEWRCELAELLCRQGKEGEAREQLRRVLQQQSDHARARELLRSMAH